MEQLEPIPSPPGRHWRQWKHVAMHGSVLLLVCCGIALAWNRVVHPSIFFGQVEVLQAAVTSPDSGLLTNVWVALFQEVHAGDLVAEVVAPEAHSGNTQVESTPTDLQKIYERAAYIARNASPAEVTNSFQQALGEETTKAPEHKLKIVHLLAPISGIVTSIHHQPGEQIAPGRAIASLTSKTSSRIIGYLPLASPVTPQLGMKVEVRPHSSMRKRGFGQIIGLGPHLEFVTNVVAQPALVRPAAVPPMGRPISISLPPELNLLPGEPVDLVLRPD